jgi:hypothetical protein
VRASERASELGKEGEAPSEGRLDAAPAGGREGSESANSWRQRNKTSETDAAVYRAGREKGDAVGRRGREGRARRRACLSGSRSRPGRPPPLFRAVTTFGPSATPSSAQTDREKGVVRSCMYLSRPLPDRLLLPTRSQRSERRLGCPSPRDARSCVTGRRWPKARNRSAPIDEITEGLSCMSWMGGPGRGRTGNGSRYKRDACGRVERP